MDKIEILRFISNFNPVSDDFAEIYPNRNQETVNKIDKLLLELVLDDLITGITNSRHTTKDNPIPSIDIFKIKLTEKGKQMLQ